MRRTPDWGVVSHSVGRTLFRGGKYDNNSGKIVKNRVKATLERVEINI